MFQKCNLSYHFAQLKKFWLERLFIYSPGKEIEIDLRKLFQFRVCRTTGGLSLKAETKVRMDKNLELAGRERNRTPRERVPVRTEAGIKRGPGGLDLLICIIYEECRLAFCFAFLETTTNHNFKAILSILPCRNPAQICYTIVALLSDPAQFL